MRLQLGAKFTLVLSAVFLGGILATWLVFSTLMQHHAEQEMTARANALIETMNSVRHYTSTQINPLLQDDLITSPDFIAESVPAYSAREVFEQLRTHPEYAQFFYKEATLNPTNERDLADPFETTLVEQFRADINLTHLSGFAERDGQQVYYNARPLRVSSESCLRCHSTPDVAPESLISTYGIDGGFGWQIGETIAAQIIYVPAADVFGAAQSWINLTMVVVIVIFAIVVIVTNFLLRRMVVRPVGTIARTARQISVDENWTPDAAQVAEVTRMASRQDEIGQTATVFAQMAQRIYQREQRLKQEVQRLNVQIDAARREQEVRQITETEYFQDLQKRAKDLRQIRRARPLAQSEG